MPVVTRSVASVTPAGSSTTRLNAGRDELPEIVWPRDPFNVSVLVPWTIVPLLTMLPATETLLPFSRNVPTTVRLPAIDEGVVTGRRRERARGHGQVMQDRHRGPERGRPAIADDVVERHARAADRAAGEDDASSCPGRRVPAVYVQPVAVRIVPARVSVPEGLLMTSGGRLPRPWSTRRSGSGRRCR